MAHVLWARSTRRWRVLLWLVCTGCAHAPRACTEPQPRFAQARDRDAVAAGTDGASSTRNRSHGSSRRSAADTERERAHACKKHKKARRNKTRANRARRGRSEDTTLDERATTNDDSRDSQDDALGALSDSGSVQSEGSSDVLEARPSSPGAADAAHSGSDVGEDIAERSPESESSSTGDEAEPDSTAPRPLGWGSSLELYAGITTRNITLPNFTGPVALDTGIVPALGIRLTAQKRNAGSYFGASLAYRSSVTATATQPASDPVAPSLLTSIHVHQLDGGVSAGFTFGAGPRSTALGLLLGYGVRAFGSVVEVRVPRFSLHGPIVRLAFELPLGDHVLIRVAPEAQLLLSVSRDLVDSAGVTGPVLAYGGEACLRVDVSKRVGFQLSYRESHASAGTPSGQTFTDVERFALLGMLVNYL